MIVLAMMMMMMVMAMMGKGASILSSYYDQDKDHKKSNESDRQLFTHSELFRYISDLAWHFDAVHPHVLVHCERHRAVQD